MSKLRKSAQGRECQIRIPGVCNFDVETTVLAHRNGSGLGMKAPDYAASFACSACHDLVDGRTATNFSTSLLTVWLDDGIFRTQEIWVSEGLIKHA